MLYSIVIEYKEDTFVIQSVGDSPDDAISSGVKSHSHGNIRIFNSTQFLELSKEIENKGKSCVAIDGLQCVWVNTYLVQDELVQMHVIQTNGKK